MGGKRQRQEKQKEFRNRTSKSQVFEKISCQGSDLLYMRISHLLLGKENPAQSGRSSVQQVRAALQKGFSAVIRGHLAAMIWVTV